MNFHEFLFDSHGGHTSSLVKDLFDTKSFADVTLVCHDNIKLKAHKFILSSYSEVFELTLKMVNDIVYIPKVRQEEMLLVLQFMYTGKVEVPKKSIPEFSQAVQELKVKYIDDKCLVQLRVEHTEGKNVEKKSYTKRKRGPRLNRKWRCEICDLSLHREASFNSHMETVHHKTKYKCLDCDITFKSQSGYNYHRDSIHDKLKHPCSQCSKVMASKSNLNLHIKSKHMNVVYQCKQCPYKGTQASSLKRHMRLQHTVIKHEKLVDKYWLLMRSKSHLYNLGK